MKDLRKEILEELIAERGPKFRDSLFGDAILPFIPIIGLIVIYFDYKYGDTILGDDNYWPLFSAIQGMSIFCLIAALFLI